MYISVGFRKLTIQVSDNDPSPNRLQNINSTKNGQEDNTAATLLLNTTAIILTEATV